MVLLWPLLLASPRRPFFLQGIPVLCTSELLTSRSSEINAMTALRHWKPRESVAEGEIIEKTSAEFSWVEISVPFRAVALVSLSPKLARSIEVSVVVQVHV